MTLSRFQFEFIFLSGQINFYLKNTTSLEKEFQLQEVVPEAGDNDDCQSISI